MTIIYFNVFMTSILIILFITAAALGQAIERDDKYAETKFPLLLFAIACIIGIYANLLSNNPYYELEKEVKQLIPKISEQQPEISSPIIKDLYKEIKLQEYKKKLEKEFNERK